MTNSQTGMVTAVSGSSATITTTAGNFYLVKKAGIVYFMLRFKVGAAEESHKLCTIPEGFRPTARIIFCATHLWRTDPTAGYPQVLTGGIPTTGIVEVNTGNTTAAINQEYAILCSYPI